MARELRAADVAARLAQLRALYVPERDAEARARLEQDQPPPVAESFSRAVARRLAELRALCELADYLHQARPRSDRR